MWTRKEFEKAAQKIGSDFASADGTTSINDLSLEVAKKASLNPEGIRTVVRLANVAAFEKFFEKGAENKAPDRLVDFIVGDPEMVISQLYSDAKTAQTQEKIAAEYDQALDYFGDLSYPKPELEKTATVIEGIELSTPAAKLPSRQEIRLLFKQAEDKMREEQIQAQHDWMTSLEKAARLLVSIDGRVQARTKFEKDAASLLGVEILPELRMINTFTSARDAEINLFEGEKVAMVVNTHIAAITKEQQPIIELLKEAKTARQVNHLKAAGLQWLKTNSAKVN